CAIQRGEVRARYAESQQQQRPTTAPLTRKMRCTTPEPFANLEKDVRSRRRRLEEEDARKRAEEEAFEDRERRSRETLLLTSTGGFPLVEKHQSEQDKRAAAKRAARLEETERELAKATFKAKPCPVRDPDEPTWEERYAEEEMQRSLRAAQRRAANERARAKQQQNDTANFARPLRANNKDTHEGEAAPLPKKKTPGPEEVVRRLDEAHERWRRALERAKVGGRAGTKPVDVFAKREAEAARRRKERERS
ncbi:MAG: hypothetical protein AAF368_17810, partial [Planctomycetota bacterium]